MGYREYVDCEPTYEDRMHMPFHALLCYLSSASASARLVGNLVARGVCGCALIFPQGMALRSENAIS
jgi:hypothetical protein